MIVAALIGVSIVSWLYLLHLEHGMTATGASLGAAMAGAMSMATARGSAATFLLMFVMWWVMMVGMMLPSAIPMILTFATVNRRKRESGRPFVPTAAFVAGYLVVWGVFSLAAALTQSGLDRAALMMPPMRIASTVLGGLLLIGAGVYQWTPLKRACLGKCRSPVDFVINHWHDGRLGALRMGIAHGAFCLGCCMVLMGLLFVGGVMNLIWVAGIAAMVLVEKLFPAGDVIARLGGTLMIGVGAYLLLSA